MGSLISFAPDTFGGVYGKFDTSVYYSCKDQFGNACCDQNGNPIWAGKPCYNKLNVMQFEMLYDRVVSEIQNTCGIGIGIYDDPEYISSKTLASSGNDVSIPKVENNCLKIWDNDEANYNIRAMLYDINEENYDAACVIGKVFVHEDLPMYNPHSTSDPLSSFHGRRKRHSVKESINRKAIFVFNCKYPHILLGADKKDITNTHFAMYPFSAKVVDNMGIDSFIASYQQLLDKTANLCRHSANNTDMSTLQNPIGVKDPIYVVPMTEMNVYKAIAFTVYNPYEPGVQKFISNKFPYTPEGVWIDHSPNAVESSILHYNRAGDIVPENGGNHCGDAISPLTHPELYPTYGESFNATPAAAPAPNRPADTHQNENPAATNDSETNANTTETNDSAADNTTETESSNTTHETSTPAPATGLGLMSNPRMQAKRQANAAKAKEKATK